MNGHDDPDLFGPQTDDDGDIKFDTSDDDTMTTVYTEYVDPFADFDVIKVRVTDDGHWESA